MLSAYGLDFANRKSRMDTQYGDSSTLANSFKLSNIHFTNSQILRDLDTTQPDPPSLGVELPHPHWIDLDIEEAGRDGLPETMESIFPEREMDP